MNKKLNVVEDIDWSLQKQKRSGVIPYFKIDEEIYFIMGVDSVSLDYADFGGGVCDYKDKNSIHTALREFEEESLSIFGNFSFEDVQKQYVIHDQNMLILFLNLGIQDEKDILDIHDKFDKRLKEELNPEIIALTWLPSNLFLKFLQNSKKMVYRKVRTFLNSETEILFSLMSKLGIEYEKIENIE